MAEVVARDVRFHVQHLRSSSVGADGAPVLPPVVFIHGLAMDNLSSLYYTLGNTVAALTDAYLYDLRGHGRTDRTPAGYSVEDAFADLEALLDAWGLDEPVVLVGNSFGGTVALHAALARPERVAGLVLIETHFAVEGWSTDMVATLARVAGELDAGLRKAWLENALRKYKRMAANVEALVFETTLLDDLSRMLPIGEDDLRQLRTPVLAYYGDESEIVDRAHDLTRFVADAEVHILPGCTHSVLMEATAAIRERLPEWLQSLSAVRSGAAVGVA